MADIKKLNGKNIKDETARNSITELETSISKLSTSANQFSLNVKDFGATGDGTTIDKNAIQSVLDLALTQDQLTVFFPAGTYVINGPLQVYSNTHLILDDNATITRYRHGALLINGEYKGTTQYGNIHIEGGIWDMDNTVGEYSGSVHFILGNADNITIERCTFMNNHGNHALDIAGCENVTIRDCKFIGQWADPDASRYYVEAIQLAEFTEAGQPAWGGGWNNKPCKNCLIDGCYFDKNPDNETYAGYGCAVGNHAGYEYNDGSSDIKITNCTVNNAYFGMRPCSWKDVIIDNCLFNNCREGIHLTSNGKTEAMPDKHSPLRNVVISNCIFNNSIDYDIWGRGKFAYNDENDISYIENVVISNCTMIGCTGENGSIYLSICKDIRASDNIIKNCNRGMFLTSCKNILTDNNIMHDITGEGIFTSTSTTFTTITLRNSQFIATNNSIENCGRTGVFVRYTDNYVISNNMVINCATEESGVRNGIAAANDSYYGTVVGNLIKGEMYNVGIYVTNTKNTTKIIGNCSPSINYNGETLNN